MVEPVKLRFFPLSLTGEAKLWFNGLEEGSINSWDEMKKVFANRFFPRGLQQKLFNDIRTFKQYEKENYIDCWIRLQKLLKKCYGHGLDKEQIVNIFYNGQDENSQILLDAAGGGIFLYKSANDAYQVMEDKVMMRMSKTKVEEGKSKAVSFVEAKEESSRMEAKFDTMMNLFTNKFDSLEKEMNNLKYGYSHGGASHNSEDCDAIEVHEEANYLQNNYQGNNQRGGVKTTTKGILPMELFRRLDILRANHKQGLRNHQTSITNLEKKLDRISETSTDRPTGSLPSNTQSNPRPSSSNSNQTYKPPPARTEHVNAISTKAGNIYQTNIESAAPTDSPKLVSKPVEDDFTDDESVPEEIEMEPKPTEKRPTVSTELVKPPLKAYKPKIPYPQRLRKEKMAARYGKFLEMIKAIRINVPLVDVLAGMPNYAKFIKELLNNKDKLEEVSATFLNEEYIAILQESDSTKA
uniref:uncharacterized protein LOC122604392 n=1 Tax=Erigeron canadensis TaxID=72917 RepID=UPI001CB9A2C2|nr:uncharacterized protein LOC122604392 [Erigeron canadensis]